MTLKILLAEDEEQLSRVYTAALSHQGYDVDQASNGQEAVDLAQENPYDLMILDIMMPLKTGLEALKEIREKGDKTHVIMLTAMSEIDDRVTGLDAGADDYLTKPYATKELIARIRSTLRRHEEPKIVADPSFNIGDLAIYPDRHEVRVGDEVVDLTKKEFDLLLFLAKNKNRVLKREEVLEKVWGYGYAGKTNIVDVYVRYQRSKIDEKVGKKYIHTVRGIGYVARD